METSKGFLNSLFDFSFSEFITTKIIKFLYILGAILAVGYSLFFIVAGFNISTGMGLLFLVLSPILGLLILIMFRVYLEIIIVLFKIAENTKQIANQGGAYRSGTAASGPGPVGSSGLDPTPPIV